MRLSQLRDFVEVVDAGSIRAAARRRGISQPALTKSLRLLESDVGARLVHRTAQGVILTPSGRAFLARVRAARAQLARAVEEIEEISGRRGGNVAFGANASSLALIPGALDRFRSQYPRSYVRVVEGGPQALLPLLRDESIDFMLGTRAPGWQDPNVRFRPLFRLPLAVAGRRGHPLRRASHLSDLAQAPWLLFSASWDESIVRQAFTAAGLTRPASLTQCESYAAALGLLSQTDALGLLPRRHLADSALRGMVQEIAIAERLPDLVFVIYLRADSRLTPPAAALLRELAAAARR